MSILNILKKQDSNTEVRQNIGLSLSYIRDNITFSRDKVEAWYVLPALQYEFLPADELVTVARNFSAGLNSLVKSDDKEVNCQLIVSSTSFDAYDWATKLQSRHRKQKHKPENNAYIESAYKHIYRQDFREKIVFLSIELGSRTDYRKTKTTDSPDLLERIINTAAAAPVSDYISEDEFSFWSERANFINKSVKTGRLKGREAYSAEIAYATRKPFFPGMQPPTIEDLSVGDATEWGEGEVVSLVDAEVVNNPKFLKISQFHRGKERTGYRATLCISKFPKTMNYPAMPPWVHALATLPFNVDFSFRFSLEPAAKVAKKVHRKYQEAVDQGLNQQGTKGQGVGVSHEVRENMGLAKQLERTLKEDKTAWVFGRYRIIVEAPTEKELIERVQRVISTYKDNNDIQISWPSGDQLNLFKESLPNDKVRVSSYYHQQSLDIISSGVPTGSGRVGDRIVMRSGEPKGWLGNYIGRVSGSTKEPCFFSIHSAINTNRPPGFTISGDPGSGKTFLGLNIAVQLALSGVWTIYLDPKGDSVNLKYVKGLEDSVIIDLKNSPDGILDPYTIAQSDPEKNALATEVLTILLGGDQNLNAREQTALSNAVQRATKTQRSSMNWIVDYLQGVPDPTAKALGEKLNLIRQTGYARLCFASGENVEPLNVENGLTIFNVLGLGLPPNGKERKDYENKEKLAVGIMFLLTSYTQKLMDHPNKSQPKAILIDEAWAVVSSAQGSSMVVSISKMGRSHNVGIGLISQNVDEFLNDKVSSAISTRFCFKSEKPETVIEYLKLTDGAGMRKVINDLPEGFCIMKDASNRVSRIKVDVFEKEHAKAFNTNPEGRAQFLQEKQKLGN